MPSEQRKLSSLDWWHCYVLAYACVAHTMSHAWWDGLSTSGQVDLAGCVSSAIGQADDHQLLGAVIGGIELLVGDAIQDMTCARAVPAQEAAHMLRVSRGRVYQLIEGGKLVEHPDGGVVMQSITDRLRSLATTG